MNNTSFYTSNDIDHMCHVKFIIKEIFISPVLIIQTNPITVYLLFVLATKRLNMKENIYYPYNWVILICWSHITKWNTKNMYLSEKIIKLKAFSRHHNPRSLFFIINKFDDQHDILYTDRKTSLMLTTYQCSWKLSNQLIDYITILFFYSVSTKTKMFSF